MNTFLKYAAIALLAAMGAVFINALLSVVQQAVNHG